MPKHFTAFFVLLAIAGCALDANRFPEPYYDVWGAGHCSTMFAAEVLGCTYTDEVHHVWHQVCFENTNGSWWCSEKSREPAEPCFICGSAGKP